MLKHTADDFFKILGLYHSKERRHVKKSRPLFIDIDLKPQQPRENVNWTPKTPCSMLSPLTPKVTNTKQFDWFGEEEVDVTTPTHSDPGSDFEQDPSLALMLIDITSPLGKRLSRTLSALVNIQFDTIKDYDKHCNRTQELLDDDTIRKLRSVHGRNSPVYRKRQCHRYLDRSYPLKASDRRERRRTVLSGGLNKKSRKLFRSMRKLDVKVEKLDLATLFTQASAVDNAAIGSNQPFVRLMRLPSLNIRKLAVVVKSLPSTKSPSEKKSHSTRRDHKSTQSKHKPKGKEKGDPKSTGEVTPIIANERMVHPANRRSYRKPFRIRKVPRRLINHI